MSQAKTGILLANLGTPEAPTPEAVKRYLRQFERHPRRGYPETAVVAAAARSHSADSFPRVANSISPSGWKRGRR
jgi:hypothetical protein